MNSYADNILLQKSLKKYHQLNGMTPRILSKVVFILELEIRIYFGREMINILVPNDELSVEQARALLHASTDEDSLVNAWKNANSSPR